MASVTAQAPPKRSPSSTIPVAWTVAILMAVVATGLILRIPAAAHPWPQSYDPTGHWWLSTLLATLPVVVLLGTLALLHMKAHYSALLGLATSLVCTIWIFHMPSQMAAKAAVLGAIYGLFPIGGIVLNVIFMYQLTCDAGLFRVVQESLTGITQDRRLQLLLIAFCFGAFFEGAAGFGTPVAVHDRRVQPVLRDAQYVLAAGRQAERRVVAAADHDAPGAQPVVQLEQVPGAGVAGSPLVRPG